MSYSGLFNDNNPAGYSLLVNKAPRRNAIKRIMSKQGFREVKELFDSLLGATAGGAASDSYSRAKAEVITEVGGGNRNIESVVTINRTTTAADIVTLKEIVVNTGTSPTFVADLSGNGGGAS